MIVPSSTTNAPLAIRPGEHVCCRFTHAEDRERIATAFVHCGLTRGHKVVYLCDRDDPGAFAGRLAGQDDLVAPAITRRQLELRSTADAYLPNGSFDPERMYQYLRAEHSQARGEGYKGLSMTAEMTWALGGAPGCDHLGAYEAQVSQVIKNDGDLVLLCVYDHARFSAGMLADIAASHAIDISSELAAIGRVGYLAAARAGAGPTLRLAGELDFGCAEVLSGVLDANYHGPLALDLADITFADVAGMRALRGRKGQPLRIKAASAPVRRILQLLAWDTDPDVELAAA